MDNSETARSERGPADEIELDELTEALDTVDAALGALDTDDLDEAESLTASLDDQQQAFDGGRSDS